MVSSLLLRERIAPAHSNFRKVNLIVIGTLIAIQVLPASNDPVDPSLDSHSDPASHHGMMSAMTQKTALRICGTMSTVVRCSCIETRLRQLLLQLVEA